MPFGDRTGPNGMGPRTGRGAGFCNGYNMPGYMQGYGGRGGGFGHGRGMGFGRRGYGYGGYYPQYAGNPENINPYYSKEIEKTYVENQIHFLKDQLQKFESRLSDLDQKEE